MGYSWKSADKGDSESEMGQKKKLGRKSSSFAHRICDHGKDISSQFYDDDNDETLCFVWHMEY